MSTSQTRLLGSQARLMLPMGVNRAKPASVHCGRCGTSKRFHVLDLDSTALEALRKFHRAICRALRTFAFESITASFQL
jgi:hypothetical protein